MRGRLWRATNPHLLPSEVQLQTKALMAARRDVGTAMRSHDVTAEKAARARVHAAKLALGERGPVWWTDGAPDYNRYLVKNTPYDESKDEVRAQPARPNGRRPVRPRAKTDGGPPPGV